VNAAVPPNRIFSFPSAVAEAASTFAAAGFGATSWRDKSAFAGLPPSPLRLRRDKPERRGKAFSQGYFG
jgi:hypothetical protein